MSNTMMKLNEVANKLSLDPVVARRYARYLENNGYKFQRSKDNSRLFSEYDLETLKDMIIQTEVYDKSDTKAAELVANKRNGIADTDNGDDDYVDADNSSDNVNDDHSDIVGDEEDIFARLKRLQLIMEKPTCNDLKINLRFIDSELEKIELMSKSIRRNMYENFEIIDKLEALENENKIKDREIQELKYKLNSILDILD